VAVAVDVVVVDVVVCVSLLGIPAISSVG